MRQNESCGTCSYRSKSGDCLFCPYSPTEATEHTPQPVDILLSLLFMCVLVAAGSGLAIWLMHHLVVRWH
jgi:hypothetical protein